MYRNSTSRHFRGSNASTSSSARFKSTICSPPASTPTKPEVPPRDARAFDAWLHGELARLYDSTLREPVPEELLRILREDPSSKQD